MTKNEALTANSNREFKASVFTTYYSMPENAADLYQALESDCDNSDIKPEDIIFTTLEGVLFMARKNDLAFTVQKKILVIGEHQASVNMNMPLRSAIYYGRTMERLIPPRDIYKSRRIPLPTPEFYVFYNGIKDQPSEQILRLSDAYLEKSNAPMLELTVKMINIIATAMKDCLDSGIMVDFIHAHGSEVINMLFTEFNMEDALEVRGEECFAEGKAEGKAELSVHLIRRKLIGGMAVADIAEFLELKENDVDRIAELNRRYPDATDEQITRLALEEQEKKS